MRARRHPLWALAMMIAGPVAAAPVESVTALPDAARVIDIRAESACVEASLPGARCLPADWLFAAEGGPIGFGELRWLLGTLGLAGHETVAIYPGDAPGGLAAAALLYLAGQREVVVFDGPAATGPRGETRSFSREAVFTAPMRLGALAMSGTAADRPLQARLAAFARGETDIVAVAPAH